MLTTTQRSYGETSSFSQMLAYEARLNGLHQLFQSHFDVTEPSLVLAPYLFLGNCISAHDVYRLSRLGIRYILNVAKRDVELCPYYSSDMRTLTIDLRDDDRENILRTFDEAFAFIDEARRVNSRVLVHCSHGQSRSPTIVIGYLMRTYNVSLEQCLVHVVKSRPCIIPNDGFLKQLILFDRFLVERRQRQQQEAIIQTVDTTTRTVIPIQHHPTVAPQPVPQPPPTPVATSSSKGSDVSITNTTNTSSTDSSSMELSLASTTQSSTPTNLVQVIPIQIQIPPTETIPEKIEPVAKEKVLTDDETTAEDTNKDVIKVEKPASQQFPKPANRSRLETSSSFDALANIKKSNATKATNSKQLLAEMRRSNTDELDCPNVNHRNHLSVRLTRQQWNFINSYPTHYYGSIEYTPTNYITEIYDRATKRFVPATYCY